MYKCLCSLLAIGALLSSSSSSSVVVAQSSSNSTTGQCHGYILLNIRGTTEVQGPSVGFIGMVNQTLTSLPAGSTYNVVYPAASNQSYQIGSLDAVRFITSGLTSCPGQKYAFLGYSQGASATMGALMNFTDPTSAFYQSVSAVVVIGNPYHVPNKTSNVDQDGGDSMRQYRGVLYQAASNTSNTSAGIPEVYYANGKVLDICYSGDQICAPAAPNASFARHLGYIGNAAVQGLGARFLIEKLGAASGNNSNSGNSTGNATATPTATTSSGSGSGTSPTATRTGAAERLRVGTNAVFAAAGLALAAAVVL